MTNVVVLLRLANTQRFLAGVAQAKASMHGLSSTVDKTGKVMTLTGRRTWLFNQALFTMRRLAFGVTLGFFALTAAVIKWGFEFNSQMNQARVGLEGFLPNAAAINTELNEMYKLAAITPFSFSDILLATRRLIPFNDNIKETNALVEALTNSLSAVGQASAQNLTRVSVAMAHLLATGRVTGYALNQFSRDNIQLTKMLAHHYNVSEAQIVEMVHGGLIPAQAAIEAIIGFQKTAGYEGKNWAMANKTLTGSWATLKDIIARTSGQEQVGIFEALRLKIQSVNNELFPLVKENKPIGVWQLVDALNAGLTPATGAINNAFNLLYGFLQGLVVTLGIFLKIVQNILNPFGVFGENTKHVGYFMRALGIFLGFNIALMIIYRSIMYTVAIMTYFWISAETRKIIIDRISIFWTNLKIIRLAYLKRGYQGAAIAAFELALAEYAVLGPMILLILATALLVGGLVLLYFKWQAFHDVVNRFASFLYDHWYLLAFIPIFGPMIMLIVVVIKYWGKFIDLLKSAWDWMKKIGSWSPTGIIGRGIGWAFGKSKGLLGLQHGTPMVTQGGQFMVGERGPEVVHLPRGAAVQPNAALGGGGFSLVIEPSAVNIDGRMVAEVVWKHRNDRVARR